jgi:2-polyprenyl-6-methoxyphenol hydroxylase-like FAD-dependent oxidoreductase
MFDVIVVGAGIEGSATAYHLAKQGHSTLLLEQVIQTIVNISKIVSMHTCTSISWGAPMVQFRHSAWAHWVVTWRPHEHRDPMLIYKCCVQHVS